MDLDVSQMAISTSARKQGSPPDREIVGAARPRVLCPSRLCRSVRLQVGVLRAFNAHPPALSVARGAPWPHLRPAGSRPGCASATRAARAKASAADPRATLFLAKGPSATWRRESRTAGAAAAGRPTPLAPRHICRKKAAGHLRRNSGDQRDPVRLAARRPRGSHWAAAERLRSRPRCPVQCETVGRGGNRGAEKQIVLAIAARGSPRVHCKARGPSRCDGRCKAHNHAQATPSALQPLSRISKASPWRRSKRPQYRRLVPTATLQSPAAIVASRCLVSARRGERRGA
mmetsp:Transcript_84673/g.236311  ORF Transcript_84673/g.236311 Transcript_84673/m.236311 type:complete len:288 (-) Transcript_84673:19-882(-)